MQQDFLPAALDIAHGRPLKTHGLGEPLLREPKLSTLVPYPRPHVLVEAVVIVQPTILCANLPTTSIVATVFVLQTSGHACITNMSWV